MEELKLEEDIDLSFSLYRYPREANEIKNVLWRIAKNLGNHSAVTIFWDLLKEHTFVAGGAVSCLFSNREIHDYDIFTDSKDAFDKMQDLLSKRSCNQPQFNRHIGDVILEEVWRSSNAYTYKLTDKEGQVTFQLVHSRTGTMQEIMREFDMIQCMGAYNLSQDAFCLEKRFLYYNSTKRIKISTEPLLRPMVAMFRCLKYIKYGYSLPAEELLDIMLQIHSLQIETYEDVIANMVGMEEQLFEDALKDTKFGLVLTDRYDLKTLRSAVLKQVQLYEYIKGDGEQWLTL